MRLYSNITGRAFFLLTLAAFSLGLFFASASPAYAADKAALQKAIHVDSDTLEADNTSRVITFTGDVVVEEDFLLCSDKLRITYDEAGEITGIVATGKVRIYQEDKVARAGRADYDRAGKKIVLTKDPSVNQCGNVVTGTRIVYDTEGDTAFVEGEKGKRVRAVIMPKRDCPKGIKIDKTICTEAR